MAEITGRRPSSVIHSRPLPPVPKPRQRITVKAGSQIYLVGNILPNMKVSKLPKHCDVLTRFIAEYRDGNCMKTAASVTCDEVIDV